VTGGVLASGHQRATGGLVGQPAATGIAEQYDPDDPLIGLGMAGSGWASCWLLLLSLKAGCHFPRRLRHRNRQTTIKSIILAGIDRRTGARADPDPAACGRAMIHVTAEWTT